MIKVRRNLDYFEAKEGIECDFVTIEWDDGWEFDYPSVLIYPIVKMFDTGKGHDSIVEDVCIDLVVTGPMYSDKNIRTAQSIETLRRKASQLLNGKSINHSGILRYSSEISKVKFSIKNGELDFDVTP